MNDLSKKSNQHSLVCLIIIILLNLLNGFFSDKWPNIFILKSISLTLILSAVISMAAYLESYLGKRKSEEDDNYDALEKDLESSNIFNKSSQRRPASVTYRSFINYILPTVTVITGVLFSGFNLHRFKLWTYQLPIDASVNSFSISGICFFMFFFCLLSGSYFNGLSRTQLQRWLQPIGSWLLFTSVLYALAICSTVISYISTINPDYACARIIALVNTLLGIELICNVIIELYRPRTQSSEDRPLFESRLLSLFTAHDGILRNMANTIEYQFGIKVSESGLSQLIHRLIFPYIMLIFLCLYFFDCIVTIDSDELGIIERAGKPNTESFLQPGLHFKFPRPIDRLVKIPVKKIRKVIVGFEDLESNPNKDSHGSAITNNDNSHTDKIILWNKRHHESEEIFMIASRSDSAHSHFNDAPIDSGDNQSSINLIAAAIPVFYSVDETKILDYAYNYQNQEDIIKKIAYREIITYFASADFIHVIGPGRMEAKSDIETRIKTAVAKTNPPLGLKIHYVGIMEIHPPVVVAGAFQNVIGAKEIMNTNILKSRQVAMRTQRDAEMASYTSKMEAEGYLYQEKLLAKAEALRFREQQQIFVTSSGLYKLRTFLEMFETETEDKKKYIITCASREIFIIDSQHKLRHDLLNDLKIDPTEEN